MDNKRKSVSELTDNKLWAICSIAVFATVGAVFRFGMGVDVSTGETFWCWLGRGNLLQILNYMFFVGPFTVMFGFAIHLVIVFARMRNETKTDSRQP